MAEKSLYNLEIKPAKKEDIILDDKKKQEQLKKDMRVYMFNTKTEEETLDYLKGRFRIMNDARPHDDWELRLAQRNADLVIRPDGQANVNLPIEKAAIRNKKADIQSQKITVQMLPQEAADIEKRQFYAILWDFVWMESDTDKYLDTLLDNVLTYGTAPWFEGLKKQIRTQYIPKTLEDGRIIGEPKTTTMSWIGGYAPDPRDVWVDPVHDIEDITDCFVREKDMSYDAIDNLRHDPNFKPEAIDAFLAYSMPSVGGTESVTDQVFQTREETKNYSNEKYVLMHYYNEEKGVYIVTDNEFRYILREGVIPFAHGQIPISMVRDHVRPQEMYGEGEPKLLENTKYERNTVRNQMIDSARASNMRNLAVGDNVTFNNSEMISSVMRIMNFSGDLSNAQWLNPSPQDNSLNNLDSLLRDDATWITGTDNNALAGNPTKTAFEAKLQEITKMKGVNEFMRGYDFFLTRMARQRLANIQQFLPLTTGKRIIGEEKMKGFRTIAIEGKEAIPVRGIGKGGKIEDRSFTFKDKEGETAFLELTPQLIRSNMDILIKTPTTTPVLREIDNQDMSELWQTLLEMAQTPDGAALIKDFDIKAFYRDKMTEKGLNADKYIKNVDQKENGVQEIMKELPLPPKVKQPQSVAPMPPAQAVRPQPIPLQPQA